MASNYSFPELSPAEICKVLHEEQIAAVGPPDLGKPTADLLFSIISNFFLYLDPLRNESEAQLGFEALTVLENPEDHAQAIQVLNVFNKIKAFFASIEYNSFTLRDLVRPDPKRTIQHLSCLVNFIYYRNDKLLELKPVMDEFPNYEERRSQLNSKIAELKTAISNHEMEARMDEPMVKQVESEVKELANSIQNYNKQQMSLKARANELKEKIDSVNNKISKADFDLMKQAQENSKLSSQIVGSPDKLQKALEEKKTARAEAKNKEKLIIQQIQKKTSDLENYSKAYQKISKHLNKMQVLQDQVNKNKGLEKEVKVLKSKLSGETISVASLDAKLVEKQSKVKQAEDMLKQTEREKEAENLEETQNLNALRSEIDLKLNLLDPREKKVESIVVKGEKLREEAEAVQAAGITMQHRILSKSEEITKAFEYYTLNNVEPFVKRAEQLEKDNS